MTEATEAKPKKRRGPGKIKVKTLRRIGLDDRTSEVGEVVMISKENAKILQKAGAIEVVI
ncbi:MAG: hypothetical protein GY753_07655 [Gammaproteobacteria bacterium]|nr:hypothetical protein [Gammaproteobacteria bacterium]